MAIATWLRAAAYVLLSGAAALAAEAPSEIKIGSLYAGSGQLSSASVPLHAALEWWADGVNKGGGPGATHEISCRFCTGFPGYPAKSLSM